MMAAVLGCGGFAVGSIEAVSVSFVSQFLGSGGFVVGCLAKYRYLAGWVDGLSEEV